MEENMAKTIVLDAGHGGKDPGAVGNGLQEKNLTLAIAKYCRDHLLATYAGVKVVMIRETDVQYYLQNIIAKYKQANADLFVSIHVNAASSQATGFETFIHTNPTSQDIELQRVMHDTIYNSVYKGKFPDRKKKRHNFYVLRNTSAPAILTENLFISTKNNADFLRVESNLKAIGVAHAEGVATYLKLATKPKKAPNSPGASKTTKLKRIQVAAYRTEKEAKDFEKKLNQKGFKDTSVKYEEDKYYHVYAGTYSQQRYLDEHVRKLNNAEFDTYVVDYHREYNTVQPPNKQPAKVVQVFGVGDKIKIKRGAKDLNSERTYANFVYDTTYQVLDVGPDWISFGPKPYQYTGKVSKSNVVRA